jgi:hypothetical protein
VNTSTLNQAAVAALRICILRAGPQDLPFAPALAQVTVPLVILAAFLQYRLTLPDLQAFVHALAWAGALALFTFVLLQSRGLVNRVRQTLDALFLTSAGMALLILAPFSAIAPHIARIAENPDLARSEPMPPLPALAVIFVSLWNFVVCSHIYRHALDAQPAVGALVALLAVIVTGSLASAVSALLG